VGKRLTFFDAYSLNQLMQIQKDEESADQADENSTQKGAGADKNAKINKLSNNQNKKME